MNESRHWALSLCALALLSLTCGCAGFNRRDEATASYEQTRQQMQADASNPITSASYPSQPETRAPITVESFAPSNLTGTVRDLTGLGPDLAKARQAMESAEMMYSQAVALREQNQLKEAQKHFKEAAEAYAATAKLAPKSSLQQDALFMTGECNFFADRYWAAELAYEELLKKYPNSKHLDRVQPRRFAIADYWLNLHRTDPQPFYEWNLVNPDRPKRDAFGHAMRIYDRIRLDDPTGKLADDATLALANAHFAAGKFLKADDYYTDLRQTFPSSDFQFDAHLLGLKSKLMNYQGSDYSGNALNEAQILLKQLYKQFPAEVRAEDEYLKKAGAEIRYRLAERSWDRAQRFDRRAEYGAARYYYRSLLEEYAETPFADRARQRLQQIGQEPAVPKQPLGWLVKLFPEEESVKPLMEGSSR